ncbi:RNA-binding motif, single-stranded-interacting protein [Schistosoma japonicum]|uniref:RNA-binding motif, single-stranded-interacting protein n=1 Tax=Schistosoma japonicum TaxID=6182 RepID=A0A4Z2DDZ6_SCHJA|nr:RNA-binding motif [Schistosoma japonicum]TNN14674.1 RNA-binding motif, single-stranded-interacting protein [Schistosoma japonicum]TNN14675.1 RNA-binding motif, single-stranded-interacting protein [Schistosoma japonicum]
MQPHWPIIAAMSGHPSIANGSAIPIDRHISGQMDSGNMLISALTPGYVRPTISSNVLPGSSIPSAPTGFNSHHSLAYPFPHSFSVGAHQSLEPAIAGRQFPNASINPSYHLQQFQQSASQPLPLPHPPVPYGQSLSYLTPSLVTAMGNGSLGHMHQTYANVPSQAPMAVNMTAHGRTFDSLKHFGSVPQTQHGRRNKSTVTSKTNLYISGLSESDTDETVRSLVENIVQPKSCKAMVINGRCRGSGFIDCATEEDAEKAKAHILECARTNGRKLSVKYAYENEKDALNVYVRNLPREGFSKEMLENLFQKFGHVTSVKLLETITGFTGIGFVRFATAEQAEKAVEQMNEAKHVVRGGDKPITCKLADKADPRRRNVAASNNTHAFVAAAAAAMHPQLPVTANHLARTAQGLSNLASLQALGQAQQSTFAPQFPLTAQLMQPLHQTPVVVPNMHSSSVSSQNRNILLQSTLLQNGPCGTAVPVSLPSIVSNGGNGQSTIPSTYRANLIGIPQSQMPSAVQPNQAAAIVAGFGDYPFSRQKSGISVQSANFSTNSLPVYTANCNSSQSPAHGTFQSVAFGTPSSSNYPAGLSYVHHHQQSQQVPSVAVSSSQMVILAQAPVSGLYQSTNGSTQTTTYPTGGHQKPLPSNTSTVCQTQNLQCNSCPIPETTNINPVGIITSEFQMITFGPNSASSSHPNLVVTDNRSCETQEWANVAAQKLCSLDSVNTSESDLSILQNSHELTTSNNGNISTAAVVTNSSQNAMMPCSVEQNTTQCYSNPSSNFANLPNLPSEENDRVSIIGSVPSSHDPSNHSSVPSSTYLTAGKHFSSSSPEVNGSSNATTTIDASSCQRKNKITDKNRDLSSNPTVCSRHCSNEVSLNDTKPSSIQHLNRRKKIPYSSSSINSSSGSSSHKQHSRSPPRKSSPVNNSAEVRMPTNCTLLNPSSP